MLHAIKEDVGPLRRDHYRAGQTYYDPYTNTQRAWTTLCGKTAEEVQGNGCYPSVFVNCPDCRKVMDK